MKVLTECIQLNDQNFDQEVLKFNGFFVVDFWTDWSGPCHIMAPIIEQLSVTFKDRLKVGSINFEQHADLAHQYGVSSVPTLLIFKQGRLIDSVSGVKSTKELSKKLNDLLSKNNQD